VSFDLKIATVTLLILAIAPIGARAAPAPAALLGKSIVLTWSETRQQRKLGDQNFRSIMQATISACTLAVLAAHSFVKLSGQVRGLGRKITFRGLPNRMWSRVLLDER